MRDHEEIQAGWRALRSDLDRYAYLSDLTVAELRSCTMFYRKVMTRRKMFDIPSIELNNAGDIAELLGNAAQRYKSYGKTRERIEKFERRGEFLADIAKQATRLLMFEAQQRQLKPKIPAPPSELTEGPRASFTMLLDELGLEEFEETHSTPGFDLLQTPEEASEPEAAPEISELSEVSAV